MGREGKVVGVGEIRGDGEVRGEGEVVRVGEICGEGEVGGEREVGGVGDVSASLRSGQRGDEREEEEREGGAAEGRHGCCWRGEVSKCSVIAGAETLMKDGWKVSREEVQALLCMASC